jgi:hypothetical protein
MQMLADVMQGNTVIESIHAGEERRNYYLPRLEELAAEQDDELRGALVGRVLTSNVDNNAIVFQKLPQNVETILSAREAFVAQSLMQEDATEEPKTRSRKRQSLD